MIAIDFGANDKLRLHGDNGPLTEPPYPRQGRRSLYPHERFPHLVYWALSLDDVVTESATIGSCGVEPAEVADAAGRASGTLWTISNRAVKNWCGRVSPPDEEAARYIHEIATQNPAALRRWRYETPDQKFRRRHSSVRPYDKRKYGDAAVDKWMGQLAPFASLPFDLQALVGNGLKRTPDYSRPKMLPFAMAFDEDGAETRDGYERIIGLYAHGYGSFYRRATINLMQAVAKAQTGQTKMQNVSDEERKNAWRTTRRYLRILHRLTVSQGNNDPESRACFIPRLAISVDAGKIDPVRARDISPSTNSAAIQGSMFWPSA